MKSNQFASYTLVLVALLVAPRATQAVPNKLWFEGFILLDNVIVDTNRSLTMCLVNQASGSNSSVVSGCSVTNSSCGGN